MAWYQVYNFFLGGGNTDIIDLYCKRECDILLRNQIISGDYSKTPFLVLFVVLFIEIMPRASILQRLLFRRYKRASASEGEDHNFF